MKGVWVRTGSSSGNPLKRPIMSMSFQKDKTVLAIRRQCVNNLFDVWENYEKRLSLCANAYKNGTMTKFTDVLLGSTAMASALDERQKAEAEAYKDTPVAAKVADLLRKEEPDVHDTKQNMPRSVRLLADIMVDIAITEYDVFNEEIDYDYVIDETTGGHIIDFVHMAGEQKTSMNSVAVENGDTEMNRAYFKKIRTMLYELSAENEGTTLSIHPEKLYLSFTRKSDLLYTIENLVDNSENLTTPHTMYYDTAIPKEWKKQGFSEKQLARERISALSEMADQELYFAENRDAVSFMNLAAVSMKSYLSYAHYKACAIVSKQAALLHFFDHIAKVIEQEDKTALSRETAPSHFLVGYN